MQDGTPGSAGESPERAESGGSASEKKPEKHRPKGQLNKAGGDHDKD